MIVIVKLKAYLTVFLWLLLMVFSVNYQANAFATKDTITIGAGDSDKIYTLPKTRGSGGDFLETDGEGNVTWLTDSSASSPYVRDYILVYTEIGGFNASGPVFDNRYGSFAEDECGATSPSCDFGDTTISALEICMGGFLNDDGNASIELSTNNSISLISFDGVSDNPGSSVYACRVIDGLADHGNSFTLSIDNGFTNDAFVTIRQLCGDEDGTGNDAC